MASTDARPVPRKNVAYRVTFPLLDADGDLVTGAGSLDSEVSKDGGTFADCTNEATEIATSSGVYYLDLTSTEMNADTVAVIVKSSSAKTTTIVMYPEESGDYRADVVQWNGSAVATPSVAGVPEVDVTHFNGTAGTFASGRPEVNTTHIAGSAVSTSSAQIGVNVVNAGGTAWASGAITSSVIADNAIDAAALASDVATEIRSIASGTADSGTTTTMVDAARTEADTDYWKGAIIVFTSGTIAGQARLITGFTPASDTITFAPATTQSVGTNTYEILPAGRADVELWDGSAVNALVSGRVDASVGAVANDAITAAAIAAGAIDADALAADAGTEIGTAVWATAARTLTAATNITSDGAAVPITAGGLVSADVTAISTDTTAANNLEALLDGGGGVTIAGSLSGSVGSIASGGITAASFGAGAIDAAAIATGAIDADAIAANAIGASELAADAVAEIADAVWDELSADHTVSGSFGQQNYIIRANTAQTGAAGSITLDASASGSDDFYNNTIIVITSGTGAGQSRIVSDYVGATKVASVNGNWVTNPDNTSVFVILPFGSIPGASAPTAGEVADAVWDEARSGHVAAGSFGEYVLADVVKISDDTTAANNAELFFDGTGYAGGTTKLDVNAVAISGDTGAADNAEAFFDGTGYAGTNNVIPTVTTVTNQVTANMTAISGDSTAADNLEAVLDGTGSVTLAGALGTGMITASTFAAGAIDAAAIAANAIGASELASDAVNEIADQVWREAIGDHSTVVGSTAEQLAAAGAAGDPWATALPGAYGAGTAGKIVGDNINATISSRASQTSVDTVDDFLDTEIAAIKAKTDQLTFSTANRVDSQVFGMEAGVVTAAAVATGALDADALAADAANEIADALLDRSNGIETGYTPRQALRLIAAATAGELSGAATTTITIRSLDDTANRIVATVDSDGNRSAVTHSA